ncbi:MAG: hypothetical protein LUM44_07830 [Pyrinomonadaceae bacterium]|nr:hypothetical protein [Pyrinomonadaceae bacterium]
MNFLTPELLSLISILGSASVLTSLVVGLVRLGIAYIQRNKDKNIQVKRNENGSFEVNFIGYSMKEIASGSKDGSLKKIIVEAERRPLRLVKPKKSE